MGPGPLFPARGRLRREGEVSVAEMRQLISSGSPFEAEAGYSRAVVDGEWIFVAGTTGFDYAAMTIADDPAEQARQTFRNITAALAEAGAGLADIVRVRYYVPDIAAGRIVPKTSPSTGTIAGQSAISGT